MKSCLNWLYQKRNSMSENSLLFSNEKKIRSLFCVWGNWDEYLTFHFHLFVFNELFIHLFIQNVNLVESFKCVSFHPSQRHLIQNIRQCFPRVPLFLPIYHLNWMITQTKRICLKTMLWSRTMCKIEFHHKEKWWNLFYLHVTIRICARTISRFEFH